MKNYYFRYVRHSDEAANQPNSRLAQLMIIDNWLAIERTRNPGFADYLDAGEFYDNNISGGKAIMTRGAGGEMFARAKTGDVIIAAKWDRLVRDNGDFEIVLRHVTYHDIRLVCIDANVDTSTADGRMVARMMVTMATREREKCSERTKEGLGIIKHNKGVSLCPLRPPIGWKHARKHSVKRKDGLPYAVLVPDHDQREECRFIAKKHDEEGWSFGQIASYFERNHRKNSRTGESKWSYYTIARRYKEFKAGFPAPPDCVEGRNTEQLTIEVQR